MVVCRRVVGVVVVAAVAVAVVAGYSLLVAT